jgi:hypothetical protein
VKTRIFLSTISLSLICFTTACGNVSEETKLGVMACAEVGVLDRFLQEKNNTVNYADMVTNIVNYADKEAEENLDKYGQLSVLAHNMQDALERGDEKSIMQLIAVEGECSNLGFFE